MPKGETGRADVFGHCQARCKSSFAKKSGTKWQLFGAFCATPAFSKAAHDACANDCSGPIMLDTHRSKHFFLIWHKPKAYARPLRASDFVIQSSRSGAIPVERSTQLNRQHHQDECRGRPVPDNCATASRGRGEDCTMNRVARSKVARRIEQLLRSLHIDGEDCRLSARAMFEQWPDAT